VRLIAGCPEVEMATLATPIHSLTVLHDPSCVKVVLAADGRALYFSRATIPFLRDGKPEDMLVDLDASGQPLTPWLLHLGIYAYHREFLLRLTKMPPSRLEQLEKLEQLRALEAGASILVQVVAERSVGIDTPADYAQFVAKHRR
jgi:3-deoxy-manno-octulosonate cytidylyltransferase (CMP-KDO synthetase)